MFALAFVFVVCFWMVALGDISVVLAERFFARLGICSGVMGNQGYLKLNTGIITDKLEESKSFYVNKLGFTIVWEADWFLLLATPNGADTISFLAPNHPTQKLSNFREPFSGKGIYFTVEVDNVNLYFEEIKKSGIDIALIIRSEEWGDRHFAVIDPNNIGIDFVTHIKTEDYKNA